MTPVAGAQRKRVLGVLVAYGQKRGMFSWDRSLAIVEPQLDEGLYWLIEMTPSVMRALMLVGLSQAGSGPDELPLMP